jgi:Domain of unknown function (DUF4188)
VGERVKVPIYSTLILIPSRSPMAGTDKKTKGTSLPWPKHINAENFKAHSNFFVGADETAGLKALLSIRTFIGAGLVISLFLPTKFLLVVAALMTLPQLVMTLARHHEIIEDKLRKAHPVHRGRWAGQIEGDFCVFHIGIILNGHIPTNELKRIGEAFGNMHKELEADPEKWGFYGSTNYTSTNIRVDLGLTVQYWRSQDHLNAYARQNMAKHFPAMIWSSKIMKVSDHIGFWHESFKVHAGEYEAIYVNCPQILLGKAGTLVKAAGSRKTARGRLGVTDGNDLADANIPEVPYE